jgi:hypothetical protein
MVLDFVRRTGDFSYRFDSRAPHVLKGFGGPRNVFADEAPYQRRIEKKRLLIRLPPLGKATHGRMVRLLKEVGIELDQIQIVAPRRPRQ